jgi:hypothetical protein
MFARKPSLAGMPLLNTQQVGRRYLLALTVSSIFARRLVEIHQNRSVRLRWREGVANGYLRRWRISSMENLLSLDKFNPIGIWHGTASGHYKTRRDSDVVHKKDQQDCASLLWEIMADSSGTWVKRLFLSGGMKDCTFVVLDIQDRKPKTISIVSFRKAWKNFNYSSPTMSYSTVW